MIDHIVFNVICLATGFLLGTVVEQEAPKQVIKEDTPPVWCKVNDKMEMVVLCNEGDKK